MFWKTDRRKLVISESDLQGALAHLRSLPFHPGQPLSWDRKWLIDAARAAVGDNPKVDDVTQVAPGVFAHVRPFGVDLAQRGQPHPPADPCLQLWLTVRPWSTDPRQIVEI